MLLGRIVTARTKIRFLEELCWFKGIIGVIRLVGRAGTVQSPCSSQGLQPALGKGCSKRELGEEHWDLCSCTLQMEQKKAFLFPFVAGQDLSTKGEIFVRCGVLLQPNVFIKS